MAHWSDRYLGLPYAEADCAELAARVQREVFGREIGLPSERDGGPFALSDRIAQHRGDYAEQVSRPRDGDAVLMRARGRLNHIGVYCDIGGEGWVLHALRNAAQACRHRVTDLPRHQLELEGYYRWL